MAWRCLPYELSSDGDHVIDTPPQTVYLSGDDQEVIQVHFGNSPKGNLLVKKVDSITKQPLSDVEFWSPTAKATSSATPTASS